MPATTASSTASVLPAQRPSPAIDVSGLVKTFGSFRALDGLDLEVETGQIHGFLGPNGAGKSTTIRVLLGMYRRDSGVVRVLGMDPRYDAERITRRCAYVPGDVALWPTLTGAQTLDALAALRSGRDRAREAELIEAFRLDPHKPVRSYSKGNRQKVMLVAALAAPCDLVISMSRPPGSTRSRRRCSSTRFVMRPAKGARCSCRAISWPRSTACATR